MAYQPYPYGGYQPAPYYSQPVPDQLALLRQNQVQPMMPGSQMAQQGQPMQPQMPPSNPMAGSIQNGMIWVSGQQEANGYLIAPNSAVALWDQNNPVVYLRKADSTGKPSTEVFDLVPRLDSQPAQPVPQFDLNNVVTWDKLDEYLSERLKKPVRQTKPKEDTENG